MVERVYVHIGAHKTGTTFLQQVLHANRQVLADAGVLFPGRPYSQQRTAVLELLRRPGASGSEQGTPRWDGLVSEVTTWGGHAAIISVENLDAADEPVITRLVESFGNAEIHVIYTARDLTKVIPARWHTHMRNRDYRTWQDYVTGVRRDAETLTGLWKGQDPRAVFPRWERFVRRDRIHVVTVPPSGTAPDVLWQRFCSVVGLRPERYSLDIPRRNESLGTAETEALRRINERVGQRIGRPTYVRWVQNFVARQILEQRSGQARFALPASEREWVRTIAKQIADYLLDEGYEVTGDLQDLVPDMQAGPATAPDETDSTAVLDVTVDVIAELLVRIDQRQRVNHAHGRGTGAVRRRPRSWLRAAGRRLRLPAAAGSFEPTLRGRRRRR